MMAIENHNTRPESPTVINDLAKAMGLIQEVKFLPDKVIIQLVDKGLGSKWSIELLNVRLFCENGAISSMTWLHHIATYDKEQAAFIIPLSNVCKITFWDEYDTRDIKK